MGQEISVTNIASISGMSIEQILDKMVEKKIGIGITSETPGVSGVKIWNINPMPGAIITIGTKQYRIVNVTELAVTVMLLYAEESCPFGKDREDIYYGANDIRKKHIDWYEKQVPDNIKPFIIKRAGSETISNDKTSISMDGAWMPDAYMLYNGQLDDNNTPNDKALPYFTYTSNLAFTDSSGKGVSWWTTTYSTKASGTSRYYAMWTITATGGIEGQTAGTTGIYIRPFMDIMRSAFA